MDREAGIKAGATCARLCGRCEHLWKEEGPPLHPYLRATRTELSSGPPPLMLSRVDVPTGPRINSSIPPHTHPFSPFVILLRDKKSLVGPSSPGQRILSSSSPVRLSPAAPPRHVLGDAAAIAPVVRAFPSLLQIPPAVTSPEASSLPLSRSRGR